MTVKPVLNQYNIYIAQHIKLQTLTWGINHILEQDKGHHYNVFENSYLQVPMT